MIANVADGRRVGMGGFLTLLVEDFSIPLSGTRRTRAAGMAFTKVGFWYIGLIWDGFVLCSLFVAWIPFSCCQ